MEDLALGAQDVLPASEIADMGISDVCDDRYVGLCDPCQIIDLAQMVHTHLQNSDLVLRAEADCAVVVSNLQLSAATTGRRARGDGFGYARAVAEDGTAVTPQPRRQSSRTMPALAP